MKLNKKQSELLAAEVLKALKRQGIAHVPELTIAKLRQWREKREKLKKAVADAETAVRNHESELTPITGKIKAIRPYQSVAEMVEKIKEGNTPTLAEIEDKLILKAMFTTEEDLQAFVQSIVKDFTKKKLTVTAN